MAPQSPVWIDFWASIDPLTSTFFGSNPDIDTIPAYQPSLIAMNRGGEVLAYDGKASPWLTSWKKDERFKISAVGPSNYHRFTVKQDYTAKTWDLYVDGIQCAANLGFRQQKPNWARKTENLAQVGTAITLPNIPASGTACSTCLLPSSGELMVVVADGAVSRIYVYDQNGVYRRTIEMPGFTGVKGMCWVDRDVFAVVEEDSYDISFVGIDCTTTNISRTSPDTVTCDVRFHRDFQYKNFDNPDGETSQNDTTPTGSRFQGITYVPEADHDLNPNTRVFLLARANPPRIYRVECQIETNSVRRMTVDVDSDDLFDASTLGLADISDICFDQKSRTVFVLSRGSLKIVQCSFGGVALSTKSSIPSNIGGLLVTPDRTMVYLVGGQNSFYKFGFTADAADQISFSAFSGFSLAGTMGGNCYLDDLTIGTIKPTGLYGALSSANIFVTTSSGNDAEERQRDGNMGASYLTDEDLDIGFDAGSSPPGTVDPNLTSSRTVGLRFLNVPVPANALVRNSYVQFTEKLITPADDKKRLCRVVIAAQSNVSAPAFQAVNFNISSRLVVPHTNVWEVLRWRQVGEAGSRQRTPDLSVLVKDVKGIGGWLPTSNAMVFRLTNLLLDDPDAGERLAWSWDHGVPAAGPVLHVEWAIPSP